MDFEPKINHATCRYLPMKYSGFLWNEGLLFAEIRKKLLKLLKTKNADETLSAWINRNKNWINDPIKFSEFSKGTFGIILKIIEIWTEKMERIIDTLDSENNYLRYVLENNQAAAQFLNTGEKGIDKMQEILRAISRGKGT